MRNRSYSGIGWPAIDQRAVQSLHARTELVLGAPDREHRVAHDQHDAERRRQLQQLGRVVQALQQQALDQRAEKRDDDRGGEDAGREAGEAVAEALAERPREVCAEHEQRAVREVDDARDAEDQRQAGGNQEQRRRGREAVEELERERGEGHERRVEDRGSECDAKWLGKRCITHDARCFAVARGRPRWPMRTTPRCPRKANPDAKGSRTVFSRRGESYGGGSQVQ